MTQTSSQPNTQASDSNAGYPQHAAQPNDVGNITFPPSAVHVPKSRKPKKKNPADMKFKKQNVGVGITVACIAYCVYFAYQCSHVTLGSMIRGEFSLFKEKDATVLMNASLNVLAAGLASYFFIKAIAVPSYAAGVNSPKKHWPMTLVQTITMANFLIFAWAFCLVGPDFLNLLKTFNVVEVIMKILKNEVTHYFLAAFARYWVVERYLEVCKDGDKEYFAFIKPWIVDEESEKEQMSQTNGNV